ncbi:hypothetical protein KIV56_12685 [Cryobacterium breve]|uniref:Uncharacterized protein n=1 Tax=Cryobacterium breve TaxID=1259258 RepID=A0ABY7NJG4_9MICO|nr:MULTISPECIES: hypothetical protein [Cryobacterium]MDY7542437.1 hypothetical protein [Cryobacterium sp. 5B3]MEB0000339.1 hypothetical protein [Cryobacterium sp. RTS3]MEB0267756.1 hypothetical protein [Cryobacterium sp. 10I5]MEB0275065.1 hypothetical protein [Cryobacterium sp. 5B3]WBM81638.1 hypothetical protein KIV56_12685 [Cryobacterium breve]
MSTQPHDDTTPDEPSQAADAVDKVSADKVTDDKAADKAPKERQPITTNRIVLWVIVAAIGLYFVVSGVYGILVK